MKKSFIEKEHIEIQGKKFSLLIPYSGSGSARSTNKHIHNLASSFVNIT